MSYKLKPNEPDFEVVDGNFAGRHFVAGKVYDDIPENEAHKFEAAESREPRAESKEKKVKDEAAKNPSPSAPRSSLIKDGGEV
jgi:hypothetical protein